MDQIQLSVEDVKMMLGEKDLVIFQLTKEVEKLQQQMKEAKELDKPYPFHQVQKKAEES